MYQGTIHSQIFPSVPDYIFHERCLLRDKYTASNRKLFREKDKNEKEMDFGVRVVE